jgi:hypothetical protein
MIFMTSPLAASSSRRLSQCIDAEPHGLLGHQRSAQDATPAGLADLGCHAPAVRKSHNSCVDSREVRKLMSS